MDRFRWWNPSHASTVKVATGFAYFFAAVTLLGLVGFPLGASGYARALALLANPPISLIGPGLVPIGILIGIAVYALIALGLANDKRIAWYAGAVMGIIALAADVASLILIFVSVGISGFAMSPTALIQFIALLVTWLTFSLFDMAFVAAIYHPMTREFQRVWFT